MRLVWPLLIICCFGWPAFADDARIAIGAGTQICRTYIEMDRSDPTQTRLNFQAWGQGFMTARNMASFNSGKAYRQLSKDIETQQQFLREYCTQFPDNLFASAIQSLYESFPSRLPSTLPR